MPITPVPHRTTTTLHMTHDALHRWNSCPSELRVPDTPPSDITSLHVYDFDNTLYKSPGPNRILYTNKTYGRLLAGPEAGSPIDSWWSCPAFLNESFREGLATPRVSHWNSKIVSLAAESFADPHTVSIVLTGRTEEKFAPLFAEMLATTRSSNHDNSNNFLMFNAVCLKKRDTASGTFPHTFDAKAACISDFLRDYPNLRNVTLYDDRPKQVAMFKTYFQELRPAPSFQWSVVTVPALSLTLDLAAESRLVQDEVHRALPSGPGVNWTLKCTGFFLSQNSQKQLLVQAFKCLRRINATKATNLAEYPMYIPVCRPGESLSRSDLIEIFTSKGDSPIDQQCLERSYNQVDPKTRLGVDFVVTHYAVQPTGPKSKLCNVYYKVVPRDRSTTIRTLFGENAPLIVSGHIMDEKISYKFTYEDMRRDNMRWTRLQNGIVINTTFGVYSKMIF